ncbi:MAG TPA: phosphotransferase family protein [Caulobacteraceae bacterium]|jgi:aminoglycoside phosphotransferase (APT) family kinase protein
MAGQDEAANSGLKPVDERHRFDEAALDRWMGANVEDYAGPLTVSQFKGGQSNPTYELATPGRRYVLRRKPPGKLLPSAHAVDREFRVISALHAQGYPVARPWALCEDEAVIGTAFYVMDKVEGRILWTLALPGMTPAERTAIYEAQVDALAALHRIDPVAAGLGDYGRHEAYFARQVSRWSKQYQASETHSIPDMDRLIEWLPATVPEQTATTVVHGDFRLDNMILDPVEPRVRAVLDWELSTLGDPMADLSYLLIAWVIPSSQRNGLGGLDLEALGIPSMGAVVERYCAATRRDAPPDLDWLLAYNLFRLAAICQGIGGRVRDGTAASPQAAAMAAQVEPLAAAAMGFARRAGA